MRVLHLGKFFPPHAGGMERYLQLLMRGLGDFGVAQAALVHATPGAPRPQRDWVDASGARMREVPCLAQLMFVPMAPAWPLDCARLLREFDPDLLAIHAPNPSAFALLAMPAARRRPWVLHWHADVPADAAHRGVRLAYPAYRGLERRLLRRAAATVVSSQAYLEASPALRSASDEGVANLQVIPLGLDDERDAGAAPTWPSAGLRLLAVGRLTYYKGFDVLLRALARVDGVSLLLVGDGECRAALERLAAELGVTDRARMVGQLPDAELVAAYRAADLFCLPSIDRAEAFGMVLLEAMRAGRPCVVSAIPGSGVTDVAVDGETALAVALGDADALAAALVRLRDDASLRRTLGDAGRARWQSCFRLEEVSRRTRDLYRSVLDSKGAPATKL